MTIEAQIGDDFTLEFPDGTPIEVIQQRVKAFTMETEKASMVERMRAAGYTEEEIRQDFNPDSLTDPRFGEDQSQAEALLGLGKWGWERGMGGAQFLKRLVGADTSDIEAELRERDRLDEKSGLNDSGYATVGSLMPYAAAATLAPGSTAGAFTQAGGEGLLEGMTQPVANPGQDYAVEKLKQLGMETGIGLAVPGVIEVGGAAARAGKAAPGMAADHFMGPGPRSSEGNALADRTGISLSPGERNQKGLTQMLEQAAAESPRFKTQFEKIQEVKSGEFETFINKFWDEAELERLAPADAARKVQETTEEYVQKLIKDRRTQADIDYADVRAWEDGRPMIDAGSYRTELERVSADGRTAGATEDQIKAAGIADDRLARLEEQYGYLTGKDIEQVSRSGQSGGSVWDMADRKYEDVLNARLREAVDADLAGHPDLKGAIENARANYKTNSNAIESIEDIALGKAIGEDLASDITGVSRRTVSPEKALDNVWKEDPEAFMNTLQVVDQIDPEVGLQLRMAYLDRAVRASKMRTASGGVGEEIDYVAFLQALGLTGNAKTRLKNMEKMYMMFEGTPLEGMGRDLVDVSRRLADSRHRNFSNTDIRREMREHVDDVAQGAFAVAALSSGSPMQIMERLGWFTRKGLSYGTSRAVIDRMDPSGAGYLHGRPNRGPRPGVTLPRTQGATTPALLGLDMEGQE